jgi:heme-degrading monooxygenase HmoA
VIRSIVLLKFKPDTTEEQIAAMMAGAEAMLQQQRGRRGHTLSRDLGLKDGRMSLAAIIDFEDEAAFRAYDTNEGHERLRREVLAPIVEHRASCQIRVS